MSKIIDIQRSVVIDLDWLETVINRYTQPGHYRRGVFTALNKVKQNSTSLSKVCEVAVSKGLFIASPISDINIAEKAKQEFLNSKIEIE